ncbi:MAG TPA: MMPL family transporter [Dermatophilaceae bacterium]|nr:MMPL family transporter [Dermatophilaceae bacterium]
MDRTTPEGDIATLRPPPSSAPAAPQRAVRPPAAVRRDLYDTICRRLVLPHRVGILVLAAMFLLGGGWWARDVASHMSSGGFDMPGSASAQVASIVDAAYPAHDANLVLLVSARHGTVDDEAVATQGRLVTAVVAELPGVTHVASYWKPAPDAPRSPDRRQALVLATVPGSDDDVTRALDRLSPSLEFDRATVSVALGGPGQVYREIADRVEQDLRRAELLAFPLTGLLLLIVFGTPMAAGLPLVMGSVSVVGTVVILRAISILTDVSVYALNLATGLGLGLAIDYALFMVARFRRERASGLDLPDALAATMRTAGRSVTVSGLTVATSLVVLLLFPLDFLKSFAYAGIAVALLAVVNALIVLPALLAMVGPQLERWPLRRRTDPRPSAWGAIAAAAMRHPVAVLASCLAALALLAAPFLHVDLALPDARVLPQDAQSRTVQETLDARFPDVGADPVRVVVPTGSFDARSAPLAAYASALSRTPHVERVDTVTGSYQHGRRVRDPGAWSATHAVGTGALVTVLPDVPSMSTEGERLVVAVRAAPAPFPVRVGGRAAQLVDVKAALADRLPLALGLVAAATLVAMLLMFRALLVPVKAVVLNVVSLSATFGAMVWIFQDGHFSDVLGFTPTGALDVTIPVLMFCMAFGLSMDYEVFLMSSMKEEYDAGASPRDAVVAGLARTGGQVTSLAAIIATVFICFATSGITFIKLMGIGLALAVLLDATLIRGLLAPAAMRLAGAANWWAPRWLRRRE